jgi:hypothetical protein
MIGRGERKGQRQRFDLVKEVGVTRLAEGREARREAKKLEC